METKYLLPRTGSFYKANLHCHTTVSDGRLLPEEVKRVYREKGYQIVAYTDHRQYVNHSDLNDESFLALAGYEVDINDGGRRLTNTEKTYHFNLYDTDPSVPKECILPDALYEDIGAINRYISEMTGQGFLVCYNHPYWSVQNYDDYKDLRGCFAMEIYNHGCELEGMYGYNPQAYDEMLRTGNRLFCVAADDNHNAARPDSYYWDSCGGFTMIKAASLSYGAVIEALRQGHFYASTGPEIHDIYIEDGVLQITCSEVDKIYVLTEGRRCHSKVSEDGKPLCGASFQLTGEEGYIRVHCRDKNGNHADSNAYFLE